MIPVFEPSIGQDEIDEVVAALRRGEISGSFGSAIAEFESKFAEYCGCRFGIATSSGSTALHLAVAAAELGAGDEVLVSASTNIASALAIVYNRALPVPVDSESTTWNLDLDLIEGLITPRTRAIMPVHLFGHPVDMDRLMEIALRHNLLVIEDCAESHGATCRGRMTGSFGHMGCFSFYANKVITTGEGGMVVTNDAELAERARLLRNLAFTRPRFRHEVLGFNFRMTGMQAAMGLAQLRRIEEVVESKRRIAHLYNQHLRGVPALQLPVEMDWARNVYWMYAILVRPEFGVSRDRLARELAEAGIETRTFFCPMNQQPCLTSLPGFRPGRCEIADGLWDNGLYLPSTHALQEDTIAHISEAVGTVFSRLESGK